MSDSQIRTIERFFAMLAQPAQTAALNTALRLGIVKTLEHGQKTAAELAETCSLNPRGTQALMQVLVAAGMVEQFDEHFALSQAARLTPQSLWAMLFDQWTELEAALQILPDDRPTLDDEDQPRVTKHRQQFETLHAQMQWAATGVALKLTEALGIGGERRGLNVLDLGCGAAVYSMAIAHRDPATRVHLVDDAAGLARAQSTVNSLNLAERVEMTNSGELVLSGHHATFDLVLVGDRLHLWSVDMRQRILATAMRTLKPGGEFALVDVFEGQPRGRLDCSIFELQLMIGTGAGLVRLPQLTESLEASGFEQIQYTDLPVAPYTHGLLLATRPLQDQSAMDPGSTR